MLGNYRTSSGMSSHLGLVCMALICNRSDLLFYRSTRETFSSSPGSPLEKRAKTAGRSPAQKNGSSLNGGASTSSGHVRRDSSFSQDDR